MDKIQAKVSTGGDDGHR